MLSDFLKDKFEDSRTRKLLYNFIRPRVETNEDAEDIIQEVFLRIHRTSQNNPPVFESEKKLNNYLITVAANEIKRNFSAVLRRNEDKSEEFEDLAGNIPTSEAGPEFYFKIADALVSAGPKRSLSLLLRDNLLLKGFCKQFSEEYVAEFLQIDKSTLRRWLNEVPMEDDEIIKSEIERVTGDKMRTSVVRERFNFREFLRKSLT